MSLKVTLLKLLLQLPENNELNHQCQSDRHQTQIWSIFFMYSEYLLDYRITCYDISTDLAVILTLYLPRSASWLTSVPSDVTCFYHIILGKLALCLNDQLHFTWDLKRAHHAICKVELWGFRLCEAEQIVYIYVACIVLLNSIRCLSTPVNLHGLYSYPTLALSWKITLVYLVLPKMLASCVVVIGDISCVDHVPIWMIWHPLYTIRGTIR